MSAVERPTDGPDTELAAEVNDALDQLIDTARREDWDGHKAVGWGQAVRDELDRLRAVLARPAAGRDLTAADVRDAHHAAWKVPSGELFQQFVADYLDRIARPAVARTDGQPPAEGLDPLAHVQPGHAADDILCGDQHGPWNCTRDLQHPGQHIASIGYGQRVGAVWPAAPADDTAEPDRTELLGRACRYAEGVVFGDHPEDAPGTVRDGLAEGWMAGYLAAGQPVRGSQPEAES